jgi:hypothetical protein
MSPSGRYHVAKHKGTGSSTFNPKSSVRFFGFSTFHFYIENDTPGPGKYEQLDKLSDSGQYKLSISNGFGKRIFDKEKRVVEF